MILIVAFDLHNPKRDYEKVEQVLKGVDGSWAHPQGSVWFLDTLIEPSSWRDKLKEAMDTDDEVFVARLQQSWASSNMNADVATWLKSSRRRW